MKLLVPQPLQAYPLSEVASLVLARDERGRVSSPDCWLVWEPGTRRVGCLLDQTLPPSQDPDSTLEQAEPLVFPLEAGAGPQFLRVGRAPYCDLIIEDATVSREHVALTRDVDAVWRVEPLTNAFCFCQARLTAGEARQIQSGDQIVLGEVEVTFYNSLDLAERLELEG